MGTNDTGDLLANGVANITLGDSWTLPFYPESGYVYTLESAGEAARVRVQCEG